MNINPYHFDRSAIDREKKEIAEKKRLNKHKASCAKGHTKRHKKKKNK